MKYFRPKSALVYGSEIAVWATVWATYDTARLVGMRPVVRQIAARGRLCAGAACPVGGVLALSGGAMYRLPAASTLTPAGSVVVTDVAVMLSAALPAVVVVGAVRCCRRP